MSRIVVRAPNHLGDLLMAQPAIRALTQNTEDDVWLMLPRWAESIYDDILPDNFLSLGSDDLHGHRGIKSQISLLKEKQFDVGLLLTPSFSSAWAMSRGRVRRRLGYTGNWRSFLLHDKIRRPTKPVIHRSKIYLGLIEKYLDRQLSLDKPSVKPSAEADAKLVHLFKNKNINTNDRLIAIAPQAVALSRRWGSEKYSALASKLLVNHSDKIVLIGTAGERTAGDQIAGEETRIVNLCGETDIETAAAILAHSKLFVGNDSGLAHLAAAADIPLVVLSGADRPDETSPVSDKKTVLIKDDLDCISCVKNVCPKKRNEKNFMRCMIEMSVADVYRATLEHLGS